MRNMKVLKLGKRHRILFFSISLVLLLVVVVLNNFYRPYIYANHLFDMHLADTYTNLLGVPICLFILLSLTKRLECKIFIYVGCVCCGLILYEFVGLTFDYYDIIATLLSGIMTTFFTNLVIQEQLKSTNY